MNTRLSHDALRDAQRIELQLQLARNAALTMLVDLVKHLEENGIPHVLARDVQGELVLAVPDILSDRSVTKANDAARAQGSACTLPTLPMNSATEQATNLQTAAPAVPSAAAAQPPAAGQAGGAAGGVLKTGPYSEAEIDQAAELLAKGASNAEIAAELNRDVRGIIAVIKRAKARAAAKNPPPAEPGPPPGKPPSPPYREGPRHAVAYRPKHSAPAHPVASPPARPVPAPRPPEPDGAATPSAPLSAPSGRSEAGKSGIRRELAIWLDTCGNPAPWTPDKDLALAEGLVRGDGIAVTAGAIGIASDACRARWLDLSRPVRDERGLTIAGQDALMAELRERAG